MWKAHIYCKQNLWTKTEASATWSSGSPASTGPRDLSHSVAPGQLATGFLRISPCICPFTHSHTDWFYVAFVYTTHIFPLKVKESLSRNKITELTTMLMLSFSTLFTKSLSHRSPAGTLLTLRRLMWDVSTFPSSGYFLHILNSFCCTFVELFAIIFVRLHGKFCLGGFQNLF